MHFSFLRNLMKMVLIVDLKLLANNVLMDIGQYTSFLLWPWSPVIIIHVVFIIVVDVVVVIIFLKYNVL